MLEFRSPAKINLTLKVLGKRPDGYHHLETVIQAVAVYDTLTFALSDRDSFASDSCTVPSDERNLILKALYVFRQKTGLLTPVHITLNKRIPVEAGLGGGSSNAATTLWALNRLHGERFEESTLREWGSMLGSDVPFFFSSGTALCTGRGEQVQSLPSLLQPHPLWIIKPPVGLSTKRVYENIRYFSDHSPSFDPFRFDCRHCANDLEEPAFRLESQLADYKRILLEQGYSTVLLSGSGSALFCLGEKPPALSGVQLYPGRFINRRDGQWY